MPRDILDAPGLLPGEEPTAADPYADDSPEERAARLAWPELPWTLGEYLYDRDHRAVMVHRDWFARHEVPDAMTYSVLGGVVYVRFADRPRLCCSDPGPSFEGAYLPSPTPKPRREW